MQYPANLFHHLFHPPHVTPSMSPCALYPADISTDARTLQDISRLEQMYMRDKQQEVLEEDTSLGKVVTVKVVTVKVLPAQWPLQAELSEEER